MELRIDASRQIVEYMLWSSPHLLPQERKQLAWCAKAGRSLESVQTVRLHVLVDCNADCIDSSVSEFKHTLVRRHQLVGTHASL